MKYILDTNTVIAAGTRGSAAHKRLRVLSRDEIGMSAVVFGELLYGAYRSSRPAENLERVRRLGSSFDLIPVDEQIVERYGFLRADLEQRGLSKSDFDLLIAATAIENGATLVTNDRALNDGSIAGLSVEDWLAPGP